jgi:hypothetical protein
LSEQCPSRPRRRAFDWSTATIAALAQVSRRLDRTVEAPAADQAAAPAPETAG